MNEFIKLIDEGFKVSIRKDKHDDYLIDFKKGSKKIRFIRFSHSFDILSEELVFDRLAEMVKSEFD